MDKTHFLLKLDYNFHFPLKLDYNFHFPLKFDYNFHFPLKLDNIETFIWQIRWNFHFPSTKWIDSEAFITLNWINMITFIFPTVLSLSLRKRDKCDNFHFSYKTFTFLFKLEKDWKFLYFIRL